MSSIDLKTFELYSLERDKYHIFKNKSIKIEINSQSTPFNFFYRSGYSFNKTIAISAGYRELGLEAKALCCNYGIAPNLFG